MVVGFVVWRVVGAYACCGRQQQGLWCRVRRLVRHEEHPLLVLEYVGLPIVPFLLLLCRPALCRGGRSREGRWYGWHHGGLAIPSGMESIAFAAPAHAVMVACLSRLALARVCGLFAGVSARQAQVEQEACLDEW
jgi:hypothetical protein